MACQSILKSMLINMSHSKSTKVSLSQSKPEKVKKERNYNVVSEAKMQYRVCDKPPMKFRVLRTHLKTKHEIFVRIDCMKTAVSGGGICEWKCTYSLDCYMDC